jgi:hypothetical protein
MAIHPISLRSDHADIYWRRSAHVDAQDAAWRANGYRSAGDRKFQLAHDPMRRREMTFLRNRLPHILEQQIFFALSIFQIDSTGGAASYQKPEQVRRILPLPVPDNGGAFVGKAAEFPDE